jgi:hypothetical protein
MDLVATEKAGAPGAMAGQLDGQHLSIDLPRRRVATLEVSRSAAMAGAEWRVGNGVDGIVPRWGG